MSQRRSRAEKGNRPDSRGVEPLAARLAAKYLYAVQLTLGTRCRTRTDMLLLVRKALEPLSYPGKEKELQALDKHPVRVALATTQKEAV